MSPSASAAGAPPNGYLKIERAVGRDEHARARKHAIAAQQCLRSTCRHDPRQCPARDRHAALIGSGGDDESLRPARLTMPERKRQSSAIRRTPRAILEGATSRSTSSRRTHGHRHGWGVRRQDPAEPLGDARAQAPGPVEEVADSIVFLAGQPLGTVTVSSAHPPRITTTCPTRSCGPRGA